ncbi:MAG: PEP-CTERM sorting domain-containing protein [Rivularia sp. (in: cyanobacteria)]|jgi:hypothetical protein
MAIALSKLIFSTLIASGVAVSSIAAPAHAKNGNGNGNGNGGGNKKTTTTTTTNNTNDESSNETSSDIACDINNVSLGGIFATSCEGPFSGHDTRGGEFLSQLNDGLFDIGPEATWSLFGKSDGGDFDAGSNPTGEWSLEKALTSNTFVISLKTSTAYSAYLFEDFDFSKEGALQGLYNTIGVALDGSGEEGKELSHASIFVANQPKKPVKTKVPEPAGVIGLGFVTGAMFIKRRRKSNLDA